MGTPLNEALLYNKAKKKTGIYSICAVNHISWAAVGLLGLLHHHYVKVPRVLLALPGGTFKCSTWKNSAEVRRRLAGLAG